MKKLLFALPVILLVAAGCNSPSQQTQRTPTPPTIITNNPSPSPVVKQQQNLTINDNAKIFANLSKELQQKDSSVTLTPTQGYIITTSIVSHNKDKIVYAEISDCIKAANSYDDSVSSTCTNWKYNIFVKDIVNGNIHKIYSYPQKTSWYKDFFVKEAQAGGCTLIDFPLAWSKNDKKIILELGNPTSCGSGGYLQYWFHSINPDGGTIADLAYNGAVFLDSYNKVVDINYNPNKGLCDSMGQNIGESILLKEVETGKITKLVGATDTDYAILGVNTQQTELNYTARAIGQIPSGCFGYISTNTPPTLHLQLP